MKKMILFFTVSFIFLSCNSNNGINTPSIDGAFFERTNYFLETPVDINNDGIFSTDILDEQSCFADGILFTPNEKVINPKFSGIELKIITDSNGNQIQMMDCLILDGTLPTYAQIDDEVHILYGNEIDLIGEISADGNKIIFNIKNEILEEIAYLGNFILDSNGSTIQYQGGATIIYTRQ